MSETFVQLTQKAQERIDDAIEMLAAGDRREACRHLREAHRDIANAIHRIEHHPENP